MTDPDHINNLRDAAVAADFDLGAVLAYVKGSERDWKRYARQHGLRCIHEWLSQHPGITWQERWVAADGDLTVETQFLAYDEAHKRATAETGATNPRFLRHGLSGHSSASG